MDNIEDILRALAEDAPEDSGSKDEVSQDGGLFSGLDLGSMAKIAGLLSAAGNTSDDEKLLMALKPLLREENRGKVDTAMRLLKLIELLPLLKESGIFGINMVWNSEQSPLYRTVESFNNSTCKPEEDPVERQCGEPKCGAAPEVGKCRSEQPRKCSPPPGNIGGILQKLTGDRDSLLIIALIILLWREKADMKLIAALAFILLT